MKLTFNFANRCPFLKANSVLPRFRILQIGDLHLPSAIEYSKSVDSKDSRFPPDLKRIISKPPLRKAFEKIYDLICGSDISAILFMGDLTDYGELSGYQACASYIASSLQIGSKGSIKDLPVGIVSGNHDVDRLLAKNPSNNAKFSPLTNALAQVGLPRVPIKDPLWINLKDGNSSVQIALLNSCWGCGSPEFIPEEFRDDVQTAIDTAIARGTSQREIKAYYERQFDTPAFSEETIQKLVADAQDQQESALIVVAHHNLLPQRLPRLAPYTELVNSGALRTALEELERPVVYLHGHIHQDPVEILRVPNGMPLVSISAPEISSGFNMIELVFTRDGIPASCRIVKWRFDGAGFLKFEAPTTISLIGYRRMSTDISLPKLFQVILDAKQLYWSQLVTDASFYSDHIKLEEDLELLLAENLIKIENYSMSSKHWIIGAQL